MAKYRKKPIVVEAFQMTLERRWDNSEWPEWVHLAWNEEEGEVGALSPHPEDDWASDHKSAQDLACVTLEGTMRVRTGSGAEPGDWIIQGVKGEIYPCKPDIFEATYAFVEEDAPILDQTPAPVGV